MLQGRVGIRESSIKGMPLCQTCLEASELLAVDAGKRELGCWLSYDARVRD